MNFLTACKTRYYSKAHSDELKIQIHEKLNHNIEEISPEMLCIFHDILNQEPCNYWNHSVYIQTYFMLDKLFHESNGDILFEDKLIEHFLTGYHSYCQITDSIKDLEQLNDNPELKNRLYRIPTYEAIVEKCLSNFFQVIVLVFGQTKKDFTQIKESSQVYDLLRNNYFDLLVADLNENISDAIKQGGILLKESGKEIAFLYQENKKSQILSISANDFDTLINKAYDTASGVLLGLCNFLNDHIDLIKVDRKEKSYLSFGLFQMELSIPSIRCKGINDSNEDDQLNVDIIIENGERTFILQTAIELSMLVYERYPDYKKYYFSFHNDRLQTSWVRFEKEEIYDMIHKNRTFENVLSQIYERKDCEISDSSMEDIDLQDVKYFRFPNYQGEGFTINQLEDVSLQDRKRIKANLYLGDVCEKHRILEIVREAIHWLSFIETVANPKIQWKHGMMEADSIYINIYRFDSRMNKNISMQNQNFVCFVDYNLDGETILKDGDMSLDIWNELHHERNGDIRIAWRDETYIAINTMKVGRNEPCPCGSGKKYKKCCIDKMIS